MKLEAVVLAVADIERSKKFYIDLFDQQVQFDFGQNVSFTGGFSIQKDFARLVNISARQVNPKFCNMELYFEVEDFDGFIKKISTYNQIKYVHPPKLYHWQQRVVRIYDPDNHIIEIGEAMQVVIKNLLEKGKTAAEVSDLTQHPLEYVKKVKAKL